MMTLYAASLALSLARIRLHDASSTCRLAPSADARVSDDSVFCYKCGNALTEQSVYLELLDAPIESLLLTPIKQKRITELTNLRTVQDIILDEAGAQLRSVPSIGEAGLCRIKARADEFVTL